IGGVVLPCHIAAKTVIHHGGAAAEHAALSQNLGSHTVALGAISKRETWGKVLVTPGKPARFTISRAIEIVRFVGRRKIRRDSRRSPTQPRGPIILQGN